MPPVVRGVPPAPLPTRRPRSRAAALGGTTSVGLRGLLLGVSSTLFAMPVLLGSIGGQGSDLEIQANAPATSVVSSPSRTELPADTSADSLLDSTSVTGLLRAGAGEDTSGGVERFLGVTASVGSAELAGGAAPTFDPRTNGTRIEFDTAEAAEAFGEPRSGTPASDGSKPEEATSKDTDSNDGTSDRSETETRPEPTVPAASPPTSSPPPPPSPPPPSPPPPSPPPPSPPPPTPTAAAPSNPTEPAAPTAAPEPPSAEPTAAQWATLRQCEAWGNYTVVSGNGKYFGAYQFSQGTWDNIARASGRSDLVGVRPSDASPADQDALALSLWRTGGWASWPSCGKKAAVA